MADVWPGVNDCNEFARNIAFRYPQADFRADLIARLMDLGSEDLKEWLAHVNIPAGIFCLGAHP